MTDENATVFIDTNGFIQLRDLKDLPWLDLFPKAKKIDLMVAAVVIEELDNHKNSTNRRRRDRARIALKIIDNASKNHDLALTLREEPCVVRLVVYSGTKFDWSTVPALDPSNPDDRLVSQAIAFGNGAAVLSHDTGPRIRARIAGIMAYEPNEDWLLPAEQTDDQKEIASLKRDIQRIQSTFPAISIHFKKTDEEKDSAFFRVPVLDSIDEKTKKALVDSYMAQNPREHLSVGSGLYLMIGHSEADINKYNERYEHFTEAVRSYFDNLHKLVATASRGVEIDYSIHNESGTTANGLRIEPKLAGNGSILSEREDMGPRIPSLELPTPPEKPAKIYDYFRSPLEHLDIPTLAEVNRPRDPVRFYWQSRPKFGSTHSALQCQEFRPERRFNDELLIFPHELPFSGTVTLDISASNLPAPVRAEISVVIQEQRTDWNDPAVLSLLPDFLRDILGYRLQ